MDGAPLSPKKVSELAMIPPLPVLHAMVLGGIQAPIVGLVTALQRLLLNLVCVLEEIRKQGEGGPSGSPSEGAASDSSCGGSEQVGQGPAVSDA